MEALTQKWAIISLLEEADEGSMFYYTDFPLHVTFAGVFAVNKTGQQLVEGLTALLIGRRSIGVEADEKDMFGPNKDIAVMKIKKSPDLMNLYRLIFDWLQGLDAQYNSPQYQGAGYLPHSTFQKTGSLLKGEKRILKSVSLIDLYPNNDGYQRKILKTINLS